MTKDSEQSLFKIPKIKTDKKSDNVTYAKQTAPNKTIKTDLRYQDLIRLSEEVIKYRKSAAKDLEEIYNG